MKLINLQAIFNFVTAISLIKFHFVALIKEFIKRSENKDVHVLQNLIVCELSTKDYSEFFEESIIKVVLKIASKSLLE